MRAAFIVPAVIYLMFMSIFPFIYSVYLSFYQAKLTRLHKKFFIGWDNYKQLFSDEVFLAALKNTFLLTTSSIILEVVLAFICAKVFLSLKEQRVGYFLRSMSILPMMITPLCVALIFSYIMNPTLGILNYILSGVGVEPISWFGNPNLALWTIVFINVWQWTPFMMLLMLAGLVSIPTDVLHVPTGFRVLQRRLRIGCCSRHPRYQHHRHHDCCGLSKENAKCVSQTSLALMPPQSS